MAEHDGGVEPVDGLPAPRKAWFSSGSGRATVLLATTPVRISTPPMIVARLSRSPRNATAPSTLTTGSRYSSRLTRAVPPDRTARFHSSIPAAVLPNARKASSAHTAAPRWVSPAPDAVPANAR